MNVYDVDLETFHSWFATNYSQTDDDSASSLQSPSHGIYTSDIRRHLYTQFQFQIQISENY